MLFYVTNEDRVYSAGSNRSITGETRFVCDIGSILKIVETSCGKKATSIGKPELFAFDIILIDHFKNNRSEELLSSFIMIGDNAETDI